jgi:hypothetical protein
MTPHLVWPYRAVRAHGLNAAAFEDLFTVESGSEALPRRQL